MCFSLLVAGQTNRYISGKVTHATTGIPIPNASVFVNGTSRGAATDEAGHFRINDIPGGTYELVVSSVGFETNVQRFSANQLPLELSISLRPKAAELDVVTVEPFMEDGWKKYGRFFIENFIGTTDFARNCKLINPKVLRFRYSRKRRQLEVIANKPLIIENRALGFRIQYQLETFVQDWNKNTVVYLGYSLFEDLTKGKDRLDRLPTRWRNNRKKAYLGSVNHFMRSLYNNNLQAEGFEVLRMTKELNLEKARIKKMLAGKQKVEAGSSTSWTAPTSQSTATGKKNQPHGAAPMGLTNLSFDSTKYYQAVLLEPDSTRIYGRNLLAADSLMVRLSDSTVRLSFPDYLQIEYTFAEEEQAFLDFLHLNREPKNQRSVVTLVEGIALSVDKNGTYLPPQDLLLSDYWAWSEKIAQLLPWDYDVKE